MKLLIITDGINVTTDAIDRSLNYALSLWKLRAEQIDKVHVLGKYGVGAVLDWTIKRQIDYQKVRLKNVSSCIKEMDRVMSLRTEDGSEASQWAASVEKQAAGILGNRYVFYTIHYNADRRKKYERV